MNRKDPLTDKEVTRVISADRELKRNPWAHVGPEGEFEAEISLVAQSDESAEKTDFQKSIQNVVQGCRKRKVPFGRREFSNEDVELIARQLQQLFWMHRERLWPNEDHNDHFLVLDPCEALKKLGYRVELEPLGTMRLGSSDAIVAGVIDKSDGLVQLSDKLDPGVLRFTAAHELGHALLHEQSGLHRDRPLSGASQSRYRDAIEIEADKFAVNFLMPSKLVQREFEARFGVPRFDMTDENLFFLSPAKNSELRGNIREVSRLLAGKTSIGVVSLADRFGVSIETMAIRLEELGIVSDRT